MKKLTLLVAFTMVLQLSFAGGLLTNYNQSAQYVRMLARNAALEIDAVFYNPAGLVKMEDGWHFAFYSQTIFQTREIDSKFPLLNDGYYEGKTTIPVFPDLYAVYKKDKWAFSLGIGPAAGGGTAEFARGLPSFEIQVSKAVPGLGVQEGRRARHSNRTWLERALLLGRHSGSRRQCRLPGIPQSGHGWGGQRHSCG